MKHAFAKTSTLWLAFAVFACAPVQSSSDKREANKNGQESPGAAESSDGGQGDDEVVVAVPMGLFAGGQGALFLDLSALVDQNASTIGEIPELPVFKVYKTVEKLADSSLAGITETRTALKMFNAAAAKLFGATSELGSQQILLKYGETKELTLKTLVEIASGEIATVAFTLAPGTESQTFSIAAKTAEGKTMLSMTVETFNGSAALTKGTFVGNFVSTLDNPVEAYAELDFTDGVKIEFSPTKEKTAFVRRKINKIRTENDLLHMQAGADMDYAMNTPDVLHPKFYPANVKTGIAIFNDVWIATKTWDVAQNVLILDVEERGETSFVDAHKARTAGFTIEEQHNVDWLLKPGIYDNCATLGDQMRTLWDNLNVPPPPAPLDVLPADLCGASPENQVLFVQSMRKLCANPLTIFFWKHSVNTTPAKRDYYPCAVNQIPVSSQKDILIQTKGLTKREIVYAEDRNEDQKALAARLNTTEFFPLTDLKVGYLKQP